MGKAQPGMSGQAVYGVLKREMYRETVEYLERGDEEDARDLAIAEKQKREDLARDERVAAWKKAKL